MRARGGWAISLATEAINPGGNLASDVFTPLTDEDAAARAGRQHRAASHRPPQPPASLESVAAVTRRIHRAALTGVLSLPGLAGVDQSGVSIRKSASLLNLLLADSDASLSPLQRCEPFGTTKG